MSRLLASQLVGALVILYLVGLFVIARSLRHGHEGTWEELGRPSFLNWSIANSTRLFVFAIFGRSYIYLNDRKLSRLIWFERLVFAFAILAAAAFIYNYRGS